MSRCPNCESSRILVVLGPKPRASCSDCGCRWVQQGREQISIRRPGEATSRQMHPSLYDPQLMKPSRLGIDYLLPIFSGAIGYDDAEHMRQTLFDAGHLTQPYHSINTDVHKRIRYLATEGL